jgi:1-acyl-sn-glycerol-3-phosphate acyltransferase
LNVGVASRLAPIAAWMLRPPPGEVASPALSARRQHQASRAMCELHAIDVSVGGERPEGPALFVSNHVGYFDPMVIGALTACVSIAKRELLSWPLVGRRLRELGIVFVDRTDPASGARAIRSMLRAFRLGASVLNFPEGTTSDGLGVLPFRRGSFGAARIAGVPIVPVRIAYDDARIAWTGDATFIPHYLAVLSRGPVRAHVTFGRPIVPSSRQSARELADAARGAISRWSRADRLTRARTRSSSGCRSTWRRRTSPARGSPRGRSAA